MAPAIAVFVFCGIWMATAAGAEAAEVVVLSPHNSAIKAETQRAFDLWHRERFGEPASVRWRESGGGSSQMLRFITSEFTMTPASIGIDVFYGGGVSPFEELEAAGLLEPFDLPPDIRSQVPASLGGFAVYSPRQTWFGAALSGFGILTNEVVRQRVGLPAVKAWAGLADPRLYSWVSSADPRQSGSILMIYEIILQAYGWERGWAVLAGMSGNVRTFLKSAGGTAKEASVGEVAYSVAIDVYGWTQVAYLGGDEMSFILPDGVTAINPDAIAILKGAPNAEMARRFLTFVLGRPGQLLWMLPREAKLTAAEKDRLGADAQWAARDYNVNRMSVWPSLYQELAGITPVQIDPFSLSYTFHFDSALFNRRRKILGGLLGAWFVDVHPDCAAAWRAITQAPEPGRAALLEQFNRPPVAGDELLRLAAADWKDPVKQNELINRWQREATALYRRLRAEAERTPSPPP